MFKNFRFVPVLLAIGATASVCFIQSMRFWRETASGAERLELVTYDWRAQHALDYNPPIATNLAFLGISDRTIKSVKRANEDLQLPKGHGLYWPRHIFGRVVRELNAQGARGIGFDVLFSDRRDDLDGYTNTVVFTNAVGVLETNQIGLSSDDFFIDQIVRGRNVVLACTPGLPPHDDFLFSAKVGDISSLPDSDGVLRRAKPYQHYRLWDVDIEQQLGDKYTIDLFQHVTIETNAILFVNTDVTYRLPLTNWGAGTNMYFDLKKLTTDHLPEYADSITEEIRWRLPFEEFRMWPMGIVMAAMELGLDLKNAEIRKDEIYLPGTNGVNRTIPLDHEGHLIIDWAVPFDENLIKVDGLEYQVLNDRDRELGNQLGAEELHRFKDRLVFIGSSATGNELTDRGATPLGHDQILVSKHWNIASMVITGQFIRRSELGTEMTIIILMGLFATLLTFATRPPWSTLGMVVVAVFYSWWCVEHFKLDRLWLPLVTPIGGGLFGTHFVIMTYRWVFENQERQRIKGVFSKLVSPNVVNTLLQQKEVHLGGSQQEITVFFSDVRGFTTLTDEMQKYADEFVKDNNLSGQEERLFRSKNAAETLETVNTYLATIADQIKKHDGTLDKYIGDCVMAFWGAPTHNDAHAVSCVRATIDAQLAMHELNIVRKQENVQIELENERRVARDEPPIPLKRLLVMGSGVNTGTAFVGLMGSEAHIFNFSVFGRDVNIASRLEGVSGRSRIIIGESTYGHLKKHDPELAKTCTVAEESPVKVKGIENPVVIYEVPWRIYLPENRPEQPILQQLPTGVEAPKDRGVVSDRPADYGEQKKQESQEP